MKLNTVEELIADIRQGKMIVLMDDEDRENEGDLIMAAECVRPEDINFMAKHARGLICLTLTNERCQQLQLPLMVTDNQAHLATNFTVSIEAAEGVTTGISAGDRATTVLAAVANNAVPSDIVLPGHIFPLMAQSGGVLSRAGHTEAGCDFSRLAGRVPAAVIVEIMKEDGEMARRPELETFAQKHDLKIGTIADLIQYRGATEKMVSCVEEKKVQTLHGEFILKIYEDSISGTQHFVFQLGDIEPNESTLVRVHVSNSARDILGLQNKNFKSWTFDTAMQRVAAEGAGVVILLYHPENSEEVVESVSGITDAKEFKKNLSVSAANRQVGTGSQILQDLGVHKMRLMSMPQRYTAISGFDLEVVEYIAADC